MASEQVNHPDHYRRGGAECIDVAEQLNFNLGNVVKYIYRAGRKSGEETTTALQKALWYLQREIQRITPKTDKMETDNKELDLSKYQPTDADRGAAVEVALNLAKMANVTDKATIALIGNAFVSGIAYATMRDEEAEQSLAAKYREAVRTAEERKKEAGQTPEEGNTQETPEA